MREGMSKLGYIALGKSTTKVKSISTWVIYFLSLMRIFLDLRLTFPLLFLIELSLSLSLSNILLLSHSDRLVPYSRLTLNTTIVNMTIVVVLFIRNIEPSFVFFFFTQILRSFLPLLLLLS